MSEQALRKLRGTPVKLAYFLLNDITTTPDHPPEFRACKNQKVNQNRNLIYPAGFGASQKKSYPDLRPLDTKIDPDKLFAIAEKIASQMPRWKIISTDSRSRLIEAVAKTSCVGYRDDVIIEIRREGNFGILHMRSKSRLGRGDFGANAKRIRTFLDLTRKQTMSKISTRAIID